MTKLSSQLQAFVDSVLQGPDPELPGCEGRYRAMVVEANGSLLGLAFGRSLDRWEAEGGAARSGLILRFLREAGPRSSGSRALARGFLQWLERAEAIRLVGMRGVLESFHDELAELETFYEQDRDLVVLRPKTLADWAEQGMEPFLSRSIGLLPWLRRGRNGAWCGRDAEGYPCWRHPGTREAPLLDALWAGPRKLEDLALLHRCEASVGPDESEGVPAFQDFVRSLARLARDGYLAEGS